MNKLRWQAISDQPRMQLIEQVKQFILSSDGYLLDFHNYSDLAISFQIEITGNCIQSFHKGLSQIIHMENSPPENIDYSQKNYWILLNLTFGSGSGSLTFEIPP